MGSCVRGCELGWVKYSQISRETLSKKIKPQFIHRKNERASPSAKSSHEMEWNAGRVKQLLNIDFFYLGLMKASLSSTSTTTSVPFICTSENPQKCMQITFITDPSPMWQAAWVEVESGTEHTRKSNSPSMAIVGIRVLEVRILLPSDSGGEFTPFYCYCRRKFNTKRKNLDNKRLQSAIDWKANERLPGKVNRINFSVWEKKLAS